jgi:superfamily II DNA or RNA helicase
MKAMFDRGAKLPLLPAEPGERVDILSFVVTKAGWESLQHRLKLSPSNHVQILTRLIYKAAIDPIKQAQAKWHYLEKNHAKVILYRKQRVAVLGSFNLTKPSLGDNIECFSPVDPADYDQLENEFDRLWEETKENTIAIIRTRDDLAQAIATALDSGEEEELGEDAPPCEVELTEGPRPPWDFQKPIIQQVMDWLDTSRGDDLGRIVKLPTGAGKTLVAAEVIRRLLEKKPRARILWVCHRVELLRQSWLSLRRQVNGSVPETAWFVPQHIQTESSVRDPKELIQSKDRQIAFCTQGMLPHLLRYNRQERFDLTVVDECHRFHPGSKTYRELYKYCSRKNVPRLGLTATPLDPVKRGFGTYWNANAEAMFGNDVKKDRLEQNGFLSRLHRPLTRQRKTGFTFRFKNEHAGSGHVESELVTRVKEFNHPKVNHEVEKAWQEYRGKRQRVLCFAVTIEHADTLKSDYFAKDDSVRVVHSKTQEVNRTNLEWFKDSRAPESRMLISVLMLAEGIDLPKTDCLFMVRPTFSPELYQQMIGRGLRGPRADGTEDCAIVDFTSQFVNRNGQILTQATTTVHDMERGNEIEPEQGEEPDDQDTSGRIWTVRDLKEEVADLQDEKNLTVLNACKELARELDYSYRTLVNYLYTKPDDYPLGWEDQEVELVEQSDNSSDTVNRGSEANEPHAITLNTLAHGPTGSEGNVTRNKLLDLRACNPQRFEEIASLTNVASSTLRSYCSDQENFKRWKANNKDKMDQVRVILTESLAQHSDAA